MRAVAPQMNVVARHRRCRCGTGCRGARAGAGRSRRAARVSGSSRTSATSRGRSTHSKPGSMTPDEGIDRVVGDERRRRLQRADELDAPRAAGRSPPAPRAARWRAGRVARRRARPPGNEISPGWRRRSSRPAGEDGVQRAVGVEVERDEDGGVGAAVDVERRGLGGVEQDAAREVARELSARAQATLDPLVEDDLALERPVDGALGGDDLQALDLLVAERRPGSAGRALNCVGQPRSAGV